MTITIIGFERVSTDSLGNQTISEGSGWPVFSPDGSKIAFDSGAPNLVPGDTNGGDIFLKNLITGIVTRISTDSLGNQSNSGFTHAPVFSPDGSKIAFYSTASNLVSGDTNGTMDVFVKDLTTGETIRVSTNDLGLEGNGDSLYPVFSPDGSKIAFFSDSSNLVANDTNGRMDVFIKDLSTGGVSLVSTDDNGIQGNGDSTHLIFSPDGSMVAFTSLASNLVPGDTNNTADTFIKDLTTGVVTRVSTDSAGLQANGKSADFPVFSPDGHSILFVSGASDLAPGDINGSLDVFIKNLDTGVVTPVSTDSAGVMGNENSFEATFSPDGTMVIFRSGSSNLVANDANGHEEDVFVKNLLTGEVTLISQNTEGVQSNGESGHGVFSPDGSQILFNSEATNLVADDTNGRVDIFLVTTDLPPGIYGTGLADTLSGAESDDILYGWGGDDALYGYGGNDFMRGGDGADSIFGGRGSDTLSGEGGNDSLFGGWGGDVLNGGDGINVLSGGAGGDRFVFDADSLSGYSRVRDFRAAQGDTLELRDILDGYDPLADAIADFVRITDNGRHSFVSVDADGAENGHVWTQIARLDGAHGLTNEAQLLVDGILIVTAE